MNDPRVTSELLLRCQHVSRSFPDGQVTALNRVCLDIHQGEYLAIMGPSGSGKSTLLNLLGGLDRPTDGQIFFQGRRLDRLNNLDEYRALKVGFVFQAFCLIPTLSALENVQIPMFEAPGSARQRSAKAEGLLKEVGMSHRAHHGPTKLSIGERQRVAIARALANDPLLLLADEPTGNLDSRKSAEILDLFDRLHSERGMTLVVVTHSHEVALRAQRTVHLHDGQIIAEDPSSLPIRLAA